MKHTFFCAFIKPEEAKEQNQAVFMFHSEMQDFLLNIGFRPLESHLDQILKAIAIERFVKTDLHRRVFATRNWLFLKFTL